MNNKFRTSAVCFLLGFFIFSGSLEAAQKAGIITLVKGEVFILDSKTKAILADPSGKKGRNTQKNSEFFEGEIIQTKADARVKLEFIEGKNSVVLGPSTSLVVERAGNDKDKKGTDLELKNGSVRSVVKKKYTAQGDDVFQVKTPNAVAGVRGTVFNVSFDIKTARTNVLTESGLVSLMSRAANSPSGQNRFNNNRNEVLVKAGTKSEVDADASQPTPPKKASAKEMQNVKKMDDVESDEGPSDLSPSSADNKKDSKSEKKEESVAVSLAPKPSDSMNEESKPGDGSTGDRKPASQDQKPAADAKLGPPPENIMVAGGVENMAPGQTNTPQNNPFAIALKLK